MVREREGDSPGESRQVGRRKFLVTLAGVGGALAAARVAWGDPPTVQTGSGRIRMQATARLQRATSPLRLSQPLQLQQLAAGGERTPIELPPLPITGEPPLPSTRHRLLRSVFAAPGALLRPGDFRLQQVAGDHYPPSEPLTSVMQLNLLAQAYAEGILLTPSGCEFAPGAQYTGPDPMGYGSLQSWISSDTFGKRVCLSTADHPFPGFFLSVLFDTPGSPESKLTYALELSMEPFDHRFECFLMSRGPAGTPFHSAPVTFVPSNEGTQMALVEIRGSGGVEGKAHSLHIRRGGAGVGLTYFNWLNMVAL